MVGLLSLLLMTAAPVKLAAPGFNVAGVDPAVAVAIQERFIQQLTRSGAVKVTSAGDIAQLLGVERQKQLLGCATESASCLAELTGALGVDGVLTGSLVSTGEDFTVTARVIAARDGAVLVSSSTRVSSLSAVQDWLDALAADVADALSGHFGAKPRRVAPYVTLGASALVAAAGAFFLGLAQADAGTLRDFSQPLSGADVKSIASRGQAFETAGYVLLAGGGVGLAASALWLALGVRNAPQLSVGVAPGGATLAWGGTW